MPSDAGQRVRIAERLAGFDRRARSDAGLTPAAVAVPIVVATDGSPAVLLTVRADHLRAHSGQFALPGGRVEPGERATDAARRELREELAVDVGPGDVLGMLDDFPTRSGYLITPVVVWAGRAARDRKSVV